MRKAADQVLLQEDCLRLFGRTVRIRQDSALYRHLRGLQEAKEEIRASPVCQVQQVSNLSSLSFRFLISNNTHFVLTHPTNSFQYCSRQCQALHYPSHREDCKGIAFYTAKNVELTSSGQGCVGQTITQQLKDELNTRYARRAEPSLQPR